MRAEELIDKLEYHSDGWQSYYGSYATIKEVMIEFAKFHVQKALEQASKEAIAQALYPNLALMDQDNSIWVEKESILNAYPLENIK